MKKINKSGFLKKVETVSRVVNFAASAAVVAMTVYNLIPKYEKFEGIDAEKLIQNCSSEEK